MIIKITSIILLLFLSACGEMGAISDAKKKVSAQMRDPDSVQFRDVKSAPEDFVCGEVNAKNGFGAYSGFTSFTYDAFNDKVCIAGVSTDCGSIFDESVCTNTSGGREAAINKSFILYSEGCKTGQLNGFSIGKDFLCNQANQRKKELDAVRARYGQKILDNSTTSISTNANTSYVSSNSSIKEGASCFDLSKGEPRILSGRLNLSIYPGPPNYESIQNGDTPESNYVLELNNSICIVGDDFANPNKFFRKVILLESNGLSEKLKSYINKNINVSLEDQFAAHTGHHHEPLVASVTSVTLYDVKYNLSRSLDFTDEYGTAASSIRAFYLALRNGQGDIAAAYILPEKRSTPNFNGTNMTHFYGGLENPINLIEVKINDDSTYTVKYNYSTKSKKCDGLAIVKTVVSDGKNFIESIKPLNGC